MTNSKLTSQGLCWRNAYPKSIDLKSIAPFCTISLVLAFSGRCQGVMIINHRFSKQEFLIMSFLWNLINSSTTWAYNLKYEQYIWKQWSLEEDHSLPCGSSKLWLYLTFHKYHFMGIFTLWNDIIFISIVLGYEHGIEILALEWIQDIIREGVTKGWRSFGCVYITDFLDQVPLGSKTIFC